MNPAMSDGAEVEPSSFVGSAFSDTGAVISDEHVGAASASAGREAGLGAACGEPAVGGGVPEPMGPEALDADAFFAPWITGRGRGWSSSRELLLVGCNR